MNIMELPRLGLDRWMGSSSYHGYTSADMFLRRQHLYKKMFLSLFDASIQPWIAIDGIYAVAE